MDTLGRFEALPDPERARFTSEYRERLANALGIASGYDGSEVRYTELMNTLIHLETWLKDSLAITSPDRIPNSDERRLSLEVLKKKQGLTIDDIIARSSARIEKILHHESPDSLESLLAELSIKFISLPGVILPPGKGGSIEKRNYDTDRNVDSKFRQRFSQLILLLHKNGVFTDNITVYQGKATDRNIRELSYYIVDIPKINKQVLICNLRGEATFVVQERLPVDVLTKMSKEQLLAHYPDQVRKVIYRTSPQWELDLRAHLFTNIQETLRSEILKIVPTAKQWAKMKQHERYAFNVSGMGLTAIASRFGVKGNVFSNTACFLELGRKIYGECHEDGISLDELKKAILAKVPTAEEWCSMTQDDIVNFKIEDMGITRIATRFGIDGSPTALRKHHLTLGIKIFGDHDIFHEKEISLSDLRNVIFEKKPTFQDWSAMTAKEKYAFSAANLGLRAIAGKFGTLKDPRNNHSVHLELGREVYRNHPSLQATSYSRAA